MIDFTEEKDFNKLLGKSRAATVLAKSTLDAQQPSLLPEDHQFSVKDLTSLFLVPSAKGRTMVSGGPDDDAGDHDSHDDAGDDDGNDGWNDDGGFDMGNDFAAALTPGTNAVRAHRVGAPAQLPSAAVPACRHARDCWLRGCVVRMQDVRVGVDVHGSALVGSGSVGSAASSAYLPRHQLIRFTFLGLRLLDIMDTESQDTDSQAASSQDSQSQHATGGLKLIDNVRQTAKINIGFAQKYVLLDAM